jgi:choline dehydrogenase-like flavoprotein
MHIDARELGAQEQNCDMCIIGAGPAGISLAREFIGQGLRVALLESGGIEPDARVQALAEGPTFGDIKPSAEVNRRQLGGNANVWCIGLGRAEQGLRHALFDEIDFEPRPWLGHAGWPLRRADLMGAYERAQHVCAGGLFDYEPGGWEEGSARQLPLHDQGVQTGMFHFSPFEVFTRRYRTQLFGAPNITVYTHATAMELLGRDDRSGVASVRVGGPGQRPWVLHARNVVLAAGGYENARLLLASGGPAGLGNAHDQVGRNYHDHLQGHSGYLWPSDPALLERLALYDLRLRRGAWVMGYLKLSPQLQAREGLLNINCMLFPRPAERQDRAIEAFNALREHRLLRRKATDMAPALGLGGTLSNLWQMTRGLDYVARVTARAARGRQSTAYGLGHGGWSTLAQPGQRFSRLELWHSIEQSPHPDNRVRLSQARDALGCRKLELHWHWSQQDMELTLKTQDWFARALEHAGLGRVERVRQADGSPHLARPAGSHHLMGTTRMHNDPRQGVVDAHCRVHGLDNLYVAGSSVFPTGGYANPTLTLVALALRLADHLKAQPHLKAALPRSLRVQQPVMGSLRV